MFARTGICAAHRTWLLFSVAREYLAIETRVGLVNLMGLLLQTYKELKVLSAT